MDTDGDAKEALLNQILRENVGMSEYEAKVYLTLVRGGLLTMTELAEMSDVPKQRVYDTVDELRSEGFVEIIDDYPQKAHAVDPSEALEPIQSKLDQAEEYLDDLHETIDSVEEGVNTFKSRPSIEKYISKLVEEAERDIFVLGPRDLLERFHEELGAVDDDVRISIIVSGLADDALDDGSVDLSDFTDVADRVRGVSTMEDFAVTTDREMGLYWAGSARRGVEDEQGYYIKNDDLAFVLDRFMAESLWPFAVSAATEPTPTFPAQYLRIRDALADLDQISTLVPLDSFVVEIEGYDTDSGDRVSLEGVPVSYYFNEYDIRASIDLELDATDGSTVSVGGWGATRADYEARRLTITNRNGELLRSLDAETESHLQSCRSELPESFDGGDAIVGLDAFLDRMREVIVDGSPEGTRSMKSLGEFTDTLTRAGASESALIEWRETRTEPGGYVAHAGRLFDTLGYDVTLIGKLGEPISSVFARRFRGQNLVSVGPTTATDLLRLEDKKIEFTEPNWDEPTWESIRERLSLDDLAGWIDDTDVLSIGTFYATTELPSILDGLREAVWPMLQSPPVVHVPGGDLHRLSPDQLDDVVGSLEAFEDTAPITLTVSRRAAKALHDHLSSTRAPAATSQLAESVFEDLAVSRLCIHSFDETVAVRDDQVVAARKPLPSDPRQGSDVSGFFESGIALATAEGFSDGASLVLANAVAFHFNQHHEFPTESELRELLDRYSDFFQDESGPTIQA